MGTVPFRVFFLLMALVPLDMNETIGVVRIDSDTGSIVYPPSRPFFEIAADLSERGFAVLQYNKRGIERKLIRYWIAMYRGNATVHDLQQD